MYQDCGYSFIYLSKVKKMTLTAKYFDELTASEIYEILKSRTEIFLLEQHIVCQDMDDVDYDSLHCFFTENNRVVAYLRAYYADDSKETVKVGRVLTLQHGNGTGCELMTKSLEVIKEKMKCKKICMNAQKYASGFYEKFGFRQTSDDFLEEGVVHIAMEVDV